MRIIGLRGCGDYKGLEDCWAIMSGLRRNADYESYEDYQRYEEDYEYYKGYKDYKDYENYTWRRTLRIWRITKTSILGPLGLLLL